jgi:hypothetical protein
LSHQAGTLFPAQKASRLSGLFNKAAALAYSAAFFLPTLQGSAMNMPLYKYAVWIRLHPTQSIHTVVWANNDTEARRVAEAQYAKCQVLGCRRIADGKA